MILTKSLLSLPVINLTYGRKMGQVKDLYLNADLTRVMALSLGTEGLLKREVFVVPVEQVHIMGEDAVLVNEETSKVSLKKLDGVDDWVSRSDLMGRKMDSEAGTPVGKIGDVVVGGRKDFTVLGFYLGSVSLEGPIADNKSVARSAILDTGAEDGAMTVDLIAAERQTLQV